MRRQPIVRWLALLVSVAVMVGLLIALPVVPLPGRPAQEAKAAVASGDIVFATEQFQQSTWAIGLLKSDGTLINLSQGDQLGAHDTDPEVSPDGSKISFVRVDAGVYVMNSDGSGQVQVTDNTTPPPGAVSVLDHHPAWSPDGTKLVFERELGMGDGTITNQVYKVNVDGSGLTNLSNSSYLDGAPEWSPDGTKIAYQRDTAGNGFYQLYVMNADGSNQHSVRSSNTGTADKFPAWSPNSATIYYSRYEQGGSGASYIYKMAADGSGSITALTNDGSGAGDWNPRVSGDGSTITFWSTRFGTPGQTVYTVSSSGGAPTNKTTYHGAFPTFVPKAYPPAPPSNTVVQVEAPAVSDAAYTRKITVKLSSTGIQRFEYGWSTSSSTPPNTAYLQSTTDMVTKKGTLNYLGKYSGSGNTWNGGTQPDQNWYLWVRSVKTNGQANAWASPRLLVHTPKAPIWSAVGDSETSGHHQDADEPWCPKAEDAQYYPGNPSCGIAGAPHLTENDESFSWLVAAVNNYNSTLHVPTAWRIQRSLVAKSGATTSSFGKPGSTEAYI